MVGRLKYSLAACRFLKSFYRELGTRDPPHLPGWASPLPLGTLCPAHFQPHLQLLHKGEQEHRLENIKPDQIFAPVRVSAINHPAGTTSCRLLTSLVKLPQRAYTYVCMYVCMYGLFWRIDELVCAQIPCKSCNGSCVKRDDTGNLDALIFRGQSSKFED